MARLVTATPNHWLTICTVCMTCVSADHLESFIDQLHQESSSYSFVHLGMLVFDLKYASVGLSLLAGILLPFTAPARILVYEHTASARIVASA